MSRQSLALLAIIAAAVFSGGNPTFSKIALREIPPVSFVFIRFLLSLIFLSPFLLKSKPKLSRATSKVILLSLFATANVILFAFGVKRTTATVSQMLYATVPIIAAIISFWMIKEKMTLRKISGVILGLLGMGTVVLMPILSQSSEFRGDLIGNLMILTGAILFSVYTVLSKRFQKLYSPMQLTIMFLLTTTLSTGLFALAESVANPELWMHISTDAWLSVGYVAVMGTAIFYLLFQYAIKHGSPVAASMTLYLAPTAAFGWAAALLGERLTTTFVIGGALALTGAWLTTNQKTS